MKKLKLFHKRQECIGCGLCAEVAASYWYMDDDGLSSFYVKNGQDGPYEVADAWESDRDALRKAEQGCPVQIIKVR